MKSVGISGQLAGSLADVIAADDIEVPNNSMTQGMRDKLSEAAKEFDAILKTRWAYHLPRHTTEPREPLQQATRPWI